MFFEVYSIYMPEIIRIEGVLTNLAIAKNIMVQFFASHGSTQFDVSVLNIIAGIIIICDKNGVYGFYIASCMNIIFNELR